VSNDSEVIENVDFSAIGRYIFGTLGNKANIISYYSPPRTLVSGYKIVYADVCGGSLNFYENRKFHQIYVCLRPYVVLVISLK